MPLSSVDLGVCRATNIEYYDPRNLAEFATKLKTLDHVLVVGHSNTTPELLGPMGGAMITIEESECGAIYVLKNNSSARSSTSFHIPQI